LKIVKQNVEILDKLDGDAILKKVELAGRVCYKSESRIGDGTAEEFVKALIKRGA